MLEKKDLLKDPVYRFLLDSKWKLYHLFFSRYNPYSAEVYENKSSFISTSIDYFAYERIIAEKDGMWVLPDWIESAKIEGERLEFILKKATVENPRQREQNIFDFIHYAPSGSHEVFDWDEYIRKDNPDNFK